MSRSPPPKAESLFRAAAMILGGGHPACVALSWARSKAPKVVARVINQELAGLDPRVRDNITHEARQIERAGERDFEAY